MKLIILEATRQYIDLDGYTDITLENRLVVWDYFKSPFGLHNIDAIYLYKELFKALTIVRPFVIIFEWY
jgi:hypothetical protein